MNLKSRTAEFRGKLSNPKCLFSNLNNSNDLNYFNKPKLDSVRFSTAQATGTIGAVLQVEIGPPFSGAGEHVSSAELDQ